MITNNIDFYNYMTNKGKMCIYYPKPPKIDMGNTLVVVFTNNYHALGVCGNAHQDKYKDEYKQECEELLDWLECGNKVIMISNVIKFGTPYMAKNYKLLQQRYAKLGIVKQVIHTSKIGSLINSHYVQIRYKGIEPIKWDIVDCGNIIDPKYTWLKNGNVFRPNSQQIHYINVLNATHDIEERRKQRYLPEYTIFYQLYKKLFL
nr:MAG TPA: hypothetical protein [Caudoviricetes sp.]